MTDTLSSQDEQFDTLVLGAAKQARRRKTPEQNLRFFTEFISNPVFRLYRYPEGKGIPFVFISSSGGKGTFEQWGYFSKGQLLDMINFAAGT